MFLDNPTCLTYIKKPWHEGLLAQASAWAFFFSKLGPFDKSCAIKMILDFYVV